MSEPALHAQSVRTGVRIELLSITWMAIEAAGTIVAGVLAGSTALEVFGIDSVIEIVGGATLLWRLQVETRGGSVDKIRRAEQRSSWVMGIALLLLAVYIVIASVVALVRHDHASPSALGIVVTVIASVLMPILANRKKRVGRAIGSSALEADGFCSMVCAYMSWLVVIGVIATAVIGWWWIDAVISLSLVYFVGKEGLEQLESARERPGAGEPEA